MSTDQTQGGPLWPAMTTTAVPARVTVNGQYAIFDGTMIWVTGTRPCFTVKAGHVTHRDHPGPCSASEEGQP